MVDEVTGRLIQVRRDRLHRGHAVREQGQILVPEPQPAAVGAAQPVIQRLRQTNPVAGLSHFRAARERVAGAIDVLGQRMWLRQLRLARQVTAHRSHMCGGLARVDIAQRVVRHRLPGGRLGGRRRHRHGGHGPIGGAPPPGRGSALPPRRARACRGPGSGGPRRVHARARAMALTSVRTGSRVFSCVISSGKAPSAARRVSRMVGGTAQCVVEHAVDQVFDRPRELAQLACADHAPAPLERGGTSGAR